MMNSYPHICGLQSIELIYCGDYQISNVFTSSQQLLDKLPLNSVWIFVKINLFGFFLFFCFKRRAVTMLISLILLFLFVHLAAKEECIISDDQVTKNISPLFCGFSLFNIWTVQYIMDLKGLKLTLYLFSLISLTEVTNCRHICDVLTVARLETVILKQKAWGKKHFMTKKIWLK